MSRLQMVSDPPGRNQKHTGSIKMRELTEPNVYLRRMGLLKWPTKALQGARALHVPRGDIPTSNTSVQERGRGQSAHEEVTLVY